MHIFGYFLPRPWSTSIIMEASNPTATSKSDSNLQKNDNSNPQQGTGAKSLANQSDQPAPQAMKVVDTEASSQLSQKECRKLFVGGLPQDGKIWDVNVFVCAL